MYAWSAFDREGRSMANKDKARKGVKKEAKRTLKEKRAAKKSKKSGGGTNPMRPL
jgi:hypothetical protein